MFQILRGMFVNDLQDCLRPSVDLKLLCKVGVFCQQVNWVQSEVRCPV